MADEAVDPAVAGLAIEIRAGAEEVEAGAEVALAVRIVNVTGRAWRRTCHNYSHGGLVRHLVWSGRLAGGREISNQAFVMYECPESASHTSVEGTVELAPGEAVGCEVVVADGMVLDPSQPEWQVMRATAEAGEVVLRVTEWVTGVVSNAVRVRVVDRASPGGGAAP